MKTQQSSESSRSVSNNFRYPPSNKVEDDKYLRVSFNLYMYIMMRTLTLAHMNANKLYTHTYIHTYAYIYKYKLCIYPNTFNNCIH